MERTQVLCSILLGDGDGHCPCTQEQDTHTMGQKGEEDQHLTSGDRRGEAAASHLLAALTTPGPQPRGWTEGSTERTEDWTFQLPVSEPAPRFPLHTCGLCQSGSVQTVCPLGSGVFVGSEVTRGSALHCANTHASQGRARGAAEQEWAGFPQ